METIQAISEGRFAIENIMLRYAESIDFGDNELVGRVCAKS
jgi:hypothetical protein